MNNDFKDSFDLLDINTKRSLINTELLAIYELIKNCEKKYNINSITNIKKYDSIKDKDITEAEMLTYLYEDIYSIQQELVSLLTIFNKNN